MGLPELRFGMHVARESFVAAFVAAVVTAGAGTDAGAAAAVDTPAVPFGAAAEVEASPGVGVTGDIEWIVLRSVSADERKRTQKQLKIPRPRPETPS